MRTRSSLVLMALLSSAGLVMAAGGSKSETGSSDGIGTNPTHVTGAAQKGAGPTGSGGTGMSATGQGATKGTESDAAKNGSGMAYIDCPGNAFSDGIRTDTKGVKTECVSPESVVIEGSDNLTRDSTTPLPSEGPGSQDRITTGGSASSAGEPAPRSPGQDSGEDAQPQNSR